MTVITILRAGPLTTLQDNGRFAMLEHGVSASGPMDRTAFGNAGAALERAGSTAIEYTQGLSIEADADILVACPEPRLLRAGDRLDLPPATGNYAYLRFEREIDVPLVLGSRSTNVTVGLGGHKGRALQPGDRLTLGAPGQAAPAATSAPNNGPVRILWGLHADLFDATLRQHLTTQAFEISNQLDRMGVRLIDPASVFASQRRLTLVSDAIVPGDIQILGDGTPIVLMRDHQPTGGYPRIATIVSADLDRFAQLRPGTSINFQPVTL